jgi:pyruvate formate lyase activating enzyme
MGVFRSERILLSGIVFDIKEFAVHDGPGIRTTVFLKGCPLRCAWCHNPESISPEPQMMVSAIGERLVGESYTSERLATILNGQADILRNANGGVTFSGGEPLMQAEFVAEVIDQLNDIHILLDTSGFGSSEAFDTLVRRADLVYFDLKLIDPALHKQYTGVDNGPILKNLARMDELGTPFVARVPLVPGVTDTPENFAGIANAVKDLAMCRGVDLLPYNLAAGGKYAACGMEFKPTWDDNVDVNKDTSIFTRAGIDARVR